MPRQYTSLTLAEAKQILSAAEAKAKSIGIAYNIAVVDAGGHLLAFSHQDSALIGSIDLAINKASTARIFDMATSKLATLAQSGQPLFGIQESNAGQVVIFGGGIPIVFEGNIVGAVGTSAGTVEQDIAVAEAGNCRNGAKRFVIECRHAFRHPVQNSRRVESSFASDRFSTTEHFRTLLNTVFHLLMQGVAQVGASHRSHVHCRIERIPDLDGFRRLDKPTFEFVGYLFDQDEAFGCEADLPRVVKPSLKIWNLPRVPHFRVGTKRQKIGTSLR